MRKVALFLLMMIVTFMSISCGAKETKHIASLDGQDITPVESFGNQQNQRNQIQSFVKVGSWIYTAVGDSGPTAIDTLVRFRTDNPKNRQIIYKDENDTVNISQISVSGNWLFYIQNAGLDYADSTFYRIRKDGSEKTKLSSNVYTYMLTKKAIYYESDGVYGMSLDGSGKQKVPGADSLAGIDNGWIYYGKYISSDPDDSRYYLYRMKPNGTENEKVLDTALEDDIDSFALDNNQIFFTRDNEPAEETESLIKKTLGGKETVLSTGLYFDCLNKEGDWLFYGAGSKVYKIKVTGKGKRQLVYDFGKGDVSVTSILLYNGEVLLSADNGEAVYIKKDGTKIKL